MIINKNLSKMNTNYHLAFEYLESKFNKGDKNYRILDVGAAENPWGKEWITHIADKFVEPKNISKVCDNDITVFRTDIDDPRDWQEIVDDVEKNGMFDFVICSHTLEDVNNPKIACEFINRVGKAGFISMPSKYAELTTFETYYSNLRYCGYHHHRWIYQIRNDVLVGTPKMNFHDNVDFSFDQGKALHTEIAFLWEDGFDYEFLYPNEMLDNRNGENRVAELFEDDDLILK